MTREKAIETMDLLVSQGYRVRLYAAPVDDHHPQPNYGVSVVELGFDRIDLAHLVEQGEKLGLDVTVSGLSRDGSIDFTDMNTTPLVIRTPRRHPK